MTSREWRAVWIGGGVMMIAAFARLSPTILARMQSRLESLHESQGVIDRGRALVATAPLLRDIVAAKRRAVLALAPKLIGGETTADGTTALSALVSAWAGRRRVTIQRIESGRDSLERSLVRIEVRMRIEGDLTGVSGLIGDLTSEAPLLDLSGLSITTDGDGELSPQRLHADLTVHGWMLAPRPQGTR